jgi:hypothetical protein
MGIDSTLEMMAIGKVLALMARDLVQLLDTAKS